MTTLASPFIPHRLLPKPWWLRLVTKPWAWVTLAPVIYHPGDINPAAPQWAPQVAHERVHLLQQTQIGLLVFLRSYVFNRAFRFEVEIEAMSAELVRLAPSARPRAQEAYARDLAGRPYFWAAPSMEAALNDLALAVAGRERP